MQSTGWLNRASFEMHIARAVSTRLHSRGVSIQVAGPEADLLGTWWALDERLHGLADHLTVRFFVLFGKPVGWARDEGGVWWGHSR
jgi:hypothetical protein